MPVVILRLPKIDNTPNSRPEECPYCASSILQRWGRVTKPVKDKADQVAIIYRYRCGICLRTFREYPKDIDRSSHSQGMRRLAALIWTLGLSYRDIVKIFGNNGIDLSPSTIWRESHKFADRFNKVYDLDISQRYTIDKEYIHRVSSKLGVVVALDLGDEKYSVLGTLDEYNPISVQTWLKSLVVDCDIKVAVLGTGVLDPVYAVS